MRNINKHIYDIHGIAQIRSNVDVGLSRFFEKTESVPDKGPDSTIITINALDDFYVDLSDSVRGGPRFHYFESRDWLYFEYPWLGKRLKLLLKSAQEDPNRIDVFVNAPYCRWMRFGYELRELAEALFCVKLLQSGYAVLHAASLSSDQRGVVLPSFADTGKTTTVLALCRSGTFKYLSDDLTIVKPTGEVFCFPTFLTISLGTRKRFHVTMSAGKNLSLVFKSLVSHVIPSPLMLPDVRIDPCELFDRADIQPKTNVKNIYFLEIGPKKMNDVDDNIAVRKLIAINRSELGWYHNIILRFYDYFNGELNLEGLMMKENKILRSFVQKTETCSLLRCRKGQHGIFLSDLLKHYNSR